MIQLYSVCFGALGFFVLSILHILQGADLYTAFKKGLIALIVFWVLGYFFGLMFSKILSDQPVSEHK